MHVCGNVLSASNLPVNWVEIVRITQFACFWSGKRTCGIYSDLLCGWEVNSSSQRPVWGWQQEERYFIITASSYSPVIFFSVVFYTSMNPWRMILLSLGVHKSYSLILILLVLRQIYKQYGRTTYYYNSLFSFFIIIIIFVCKVPLRVHKSFRSAASYI